MDIPPRGEPRHLMAGRGHHGVEGHGVLRQPQRARVQARQRQQIRHQASHVLRLDDDVLDQHAVLRVGAGVGLQQYLGVGANQGQGRAQFVRDVGHKGALGGERGGDRPHRLTGQQEAPGRRDDDRAGAEREQEVIASMARRAGLCLL